MIAEVWKDHGDWKDERVNLKPAGVKVLFSQLLEFVIPHVPMLEDIHRWIPALSSVPLSVLLQYRVLLQRKHRMKRAEGRDRRRGGGGGGGGGDSSARLADSLVNQLPDLRDQAFFPSPWLFLHLRKGHCTSMRPLSDRSGLQSGKW